MRKRILLLSLALASALSPQVIQRGAGIPTAGGGGTWSLVQFKYFDEIGGGTGGSSCASGGTTCTVTISAPGVGHLLVAAILTGTNATLTTTTPTGGQTWTHCASCVVGSTAAGWADAWYVLSATATGQTTVVCNYSGSTDGYAGCGIYEYAWSGASISFDVAGGTVDAACTTACATAALTITGTDVIIQTALSVPASVGVTAISGANYSNPKQFYSNTGNAGWINATTATSANWTNGSSAAALTVFGIAFKGI